MRYCETLAEGIGSEMVDQIINANLRALRAMFQQHERDLRIVGGSVRDILNGKLDDVEDIDLATDATPDEQIAIYKQNRVHYVTTGLAHGTITVVMDHVPYEITSLRTETEHDGRHAKVAYTRDWIEDLSRRDLTVNAMALTFDGDLIDPFGGRHDLERGIVKFVGRPDDRIREDYLRILRFFRFHGRLHNEGIYDVATEDAIRANADGLRRISGERIWMEVAKIIAGPNGPQQIRKMCELGVAKNIGLPCKNIDLLRRTYGSTKNPVTLLAAIIDSPEEVQQIVGRWKLPNEERDFLFFLVGHKSLKLDLDGFKDLAIGAQHEGMPLSWVAELARLHGQTGEALSILHWKVPPFPVTGQDLLKLGFEPGPRVGETLRALKQDWMKSRFEKSKDQLLRGLQRS